MTDYQSARNVRREARTLVGCFRGGKLMPVMCVPVKGNEGGMLSQSITMELDPVMGRLLTPVYGELISVFVPLQAIDAIRDPAAAYAGMTEVLREKLLTGNPLFGLEDEHEISQRCGVNPRSIGGVKKVSTMVAWAHNAAVNHLRQLKYVKAPILAHSSRGVTRALISSTILQRLNGVLDPEDRVNGMVQLDLPSVQLPVSGLTFTGAPAAVAAGVAARGVTAALDSVTDGTERNAGVAAITHAAITENKRLSEVLAYAKALQDAAPPKVNTVGKQKSRYEPNGKKSPGRRSWLDKRAERRAEEAAQGTGQVSDV